MPDAKIAILICALFATAGLAGCLSSSATDEVPSAEDDAGTDDRAAHEVTREELSEGQIVLEPADGEWVATRFTVSQLLGNRSEANLTIASEPADGAEPYVGLVLRATAEDESLPFSFWFAMDGEPSQQTIRMEGEPPGSVDVALVLGTNGANATFRLGLTEGPGSDRDGPAMNRSESLHPLADRPVLDVEPDARGVGGDAGSVLVERTPRGVRILEHGNLEADLADGPLPMADARQPLTVTGEGQIPGAGIGGLLVAATGDVGTGEWRLDAALPPATWAAEGRDVDPKGVTAVIPEAIREMVGVESAMAYGSIRVEPGEASMAFDRDYTGLGRSTVVTWGWATFDPGEVYGWAWEDITV